jgi:hypothetical protein
VPRAALIVAVALGLAAARPAGAHLVPSGADTLLGMMAAADGMIVARSAAETHVRDGHTAATPFLAREVVAGVGPENEFVLDADPPVLRYAELQDALVLVVRRTSPTGRVQWLSAQPAGAGILLQSATLPDGSRELLRRLWALAHPATPGGADGGLAAAALVDALSLPEPKLRALAYLDLSRLAADPAHFSPAAVARLASYGDRPGDDAQLATAVRDLGRRLQQKEPPAATSAAGEGATR